MRYSLSRIYTVIRGLLALLLLIGLAIDHVQASSLTPMARKILRKQNKVRLKSKVAQILGEKIAKRFGKTKVEVVSKKDEKQCRTTLRACKNNIRLTVLSLLMLFPNGSYADSQPKKNPNSYAGSAGSLSGVAIATSSSPVQQSHNISREARPSVAIVTLSTPERNRAFVNIIRRAWRKYAKRHGYDFIQYDRTLAPERPAEWSKIKAVERLLYSYKEVLWVDDDALPTSPKISLEQIRKKHGPDTDLIVGKDPAYGVSFVNNFSNYKRPCFTETDNYNNCRWLGGYDCSIEMDAVIACKKKFPNSDVRVKITLNSGVFLIRSSLWSRIFLKAVWEKGAEWRYLKRGNSLLEQQTMTNLIEDDACNNNHTSIVEPGILQSYITYAESEHGRAPRFLWQPGDFAAHVGPDDLRFKVIWQLYNQGEKPTVRPRVEEPMVDQYPKELELIGSFPKNIIGVEFIDNNYLYFF